MYQFVASATQLVLGIRGILGKSTLRTYPFSRVPTNAIGLYLLSDDGLNDLSQQ